MFLRKIGIVLILLLTIGLTIGCGGRKEKAEVGAETKIAKPIDKSSHDTAKIAPLHSGGTMELAMTSTTLYTCPMHPEVAAANSSIPCPECKMGLAAIPMDKLGKLRESSPKGCPMCPIVVEGNSPMENCPVCKMPLKKIEDHRGHNH